MGILIPDRGFEIGASVTLPTGYTNLKNPERLRAIQDAIWNSNAYMPSETDGEEITYCNLAVQAVFEAYEYTALSGKMADAIMAFVKTSPDFLVKPLADAQALVNEGTIILAGLSSAQLGQSHGHVCTLTPGVEDYSGHWDKKAPVCLSIGRKAICFRSKGVNWAFVPEPELFAWIPSL
jgi:hypothetical protein